MYLFGFFQTDVLIDFFISIRRAEAITWEIPSRQSGILAFVTLVPRAILKNSPGTA